MEIDFETVKLYGGWIVSLVLCIAFFTNIRIFGVARSLLKQGTEVVEALTYIAERADPVQVARAIQTQSEVITPMEEYAGIAPKPEVKERQANAIREAVAAKGPSGKKF